MAELSPGSRLGRYTVDRVVGRGAVADVFLAREKVEGRMAPWHVRHREAITTTIAVVGCVAGVLSAVQPFLT